MGTCCSSKMSRLKKPPPLNSHSKNSEPVLSLNHLATAQSKMLFNHEITPFPNSENAKKSYLNQNSINISGFNDNNDSPYEDLDLTCEEVFLKSKVLLKHSGLKVEEDKEHRVLELAFSYKNLFDFNILFDLELEITKYQWEILSFLKNRQSSIIYKVLDRKSGMRALLEVIEFESENDPQIAEIAYLIHLNELITKTLMQAEKEESEITRKKKELDYKNFVQDPPILQILDYYIYQEGFQCSLKPRKWLHVVWEEWDTTLKQLIETRLMEQKFYNDKELAYIGKSLLNALKLLKNAKIAHRNFNPKNIFYVNSTKKYKIGNFLQAKLSNTHKLGRNLDINELKEPYNEINDKGNVRRNVYLSKKFSVKTISDRNLIEYKKFDHSVVGTPYYMDHVLKTAYTNHEETVRLLDGLFHSDLFAFGVMMFEVETLKKTKNLQNLINETLNTKIPIYSLKAILLKILDAEINIKDICLVDNKIKSVLESTVEQIKKAETTSKSPEKNNSRGSSPDNGKKRNNRKKMFLQPDQLKASINFQKTNVFLNYEKGSKENIGFLLSYMKKVLHAPADETDFMKNTMNEILGGDDELLRQKLMIKFYVEIGEHQKALDGLLGIREILDRNKKEINFELAEVFFEISRMYLLMNKYGTALSFLDDLRTYIEGSEMDEKWIQLKKKSSLLRMLIYKNKGDLNLALKSAKHVMAFIEKYDKAQSIYEMAMTREFIAELYFLLDDNAEAMANIQLALSFYREIELTQYTSLQLADALIFASQIYKCLLENENSEAFLNEAYVIYSNKYGDKHPVIGYITLQISEIYRDKANYPKAISYGKKAIKILRCYYHDEDNNIIEGVKNLSHIYKEAEDINQSIKLLKETIDRIDKNKMIDDLCSLADIIYNLGLCYMETNDYPNARKYLSEALEIYNSNLAEDDLVLNDIIQKITMVNFEMTKNNSNSTLEHSLYPKKTVFKNYEDGNLVNSHINLADMLMMKGEFEQSLKLYLSALKIKKDSNYTDIKLNDILMKIGLINLIAGKFDESLKYFQDCLRFQIETTYNQMTEHIMRLNLIISHLYVILDLKPQAQEYNEKTCKILTHLRSSSQTQNLDTLLANHAQQFIGIDLNKDKILDKNEVLNDLLEILQIAFHYENSPLTKIDAAQKLSLISSIHQTQGEMFSRKNIDLSTQNLSNEQQPVMIRKMNSMMGESSRNFGLNMKSPKSFTSSHKGNSLGHSGSTPRFRGDSMIFKKRSYICLLGVPGEKNGENGEYFFQEKNSGNIEQNFNSKTHGLIKQEKSFNITTSNNKQQKRNTLLDNNKIVKLEEEISDDSTFLEKQKKNKVSVNII